MRINSVRGPAMIEKILKEFNNKPIILGSAWISKNRRLRRAIFKQRTLQESLLDQEAFWAQRLDSAATGLPDINMGGVSMRTTSVRGPAKGVALERLKKAIFLKGFNKKPSIWGSAWILKNQAPAASYLQAVRAASG